MMAEQGRQCGECSLCCKVVELPELEKPRGVWCRHRAKGVGCSIHETRPDTCRKFFCTFITNKEFDERWRPSVANFFMWEDRSVVQGRRLVLEVDTEAPDAWRREPYLSTLRTIARRTPQQTVEVLIRVYPKLFMLFPEGLVDLGGHKPLPVTSGYRLVNGHAVPYAHYVEPASAPDS